MKIKVMKLSAAIVCVLCVQLLLLYDCKAQDVFSGTGYVDQIVPGKIVIDDTSYFTTASTTYLDENNKNIGRSAFRKGYLVDYKADGTGKVLSLSLRSRGVDRHYVKDIKGSGVKKYRKAGHRSNAKALKGSGITFDNGVWRNY